MTTLDIPITKRDLTSPEPFIVMLHRWYLESRKAILDLLILLTLGGATSAVLITYEFTEAFFDFTRKYEQFELDEILFTLIFVLAIYLPVFAIRRWLDAIRFLRESNTDSLTKLANRRKGWRVLESELARAARYGSSLSIILFDVDHFKEVNDRYGHLKGDHLLEELANVLAPQIRASDTLVRWGGEEFMVILTETDRAGATELAERLRLCVKDGRFSEPLRVTASFGVAQWQPSEPTDKLILRADKKLYKAKQSGRNRVE